MTRTRVSLEVDQSRLTNAGAPRYRALDGLRGAAALLVVLYHIGWTNHITGIPFIRHGYLAVDLFFILSGLVMASNYADRLQSNRDVRAFLRLRFFRLYPLHVTMLAAFVLLELAKLIAQRYFEVSPGIDAPFSGQNSYATLVANMLLVQAWHLFQSYSYNGVSWSISCEVAAYLLFAFAVNSGLLKYQMTFVVGLLLSVTCYALLADSFHTVVAAMTWGVPRAAAGFFLGVLVWRYVPVSIISLSVLAQSAVQVFVVVAMVSMMTLWNGAMVVWVLPCFVALVALLRTEQGIVASLMLTRPMQLLGQLSYSIYMVHLLVLVGLTIVIKHVLHVVLPIGNDPASAASGFSVWSGDLLLIGTLLTVITLAVGAYRLVEEPGRLYGRRTTRRSYTRLF